MVTTGDSPTNVKWEWELYIHECGTEGQGQFSTSDVGGPAGPIGDLNIPQCTSSTLKLGLQYTFSGQQPCKEHLESARSTINQTKIEKARCLGQGF